MILKIDSDDVLDFLIFNKTITNASMNQAVDVE